MTEIAYAIQAAVDDEGRALYQSHECGEVSSLGEADTYAEADEEGFESVRGEFVPILLHDLREPLVTGADLVVARWDSEVDPDSFLEALNAAIRKRAEEG